MNEQGIISAGKAVKNAIRNGLLVKPECCSNCGKKPLESRQLHGHHANYLKPLEVDWLCNRCHVERHKFLRWFARGIEFLEWCSKNGIDPVDRFLPARHKKTGVPLRTSIFQAWMKGKR